MRNGIALASLSLVLILPACTTHGGPAAAPTPRPDPNRVRDAFLRKRCHVRTWTNESGGLPHVGAYLVIEGEYPVGLFGSYYTLDITHGFPNDPQDGLGKYRVEFHQVFDVDGIKGWDEGTIHRDVTSYTWGGSRLLPDMWFGERVGASPLWGQIACDVAYWYWKNVPNGFS